MTLKNKRVLITAGPTWVPIDKVRVISNIATGETGILLAEKLQREGARVTLLLGPVEPCCLSNKIRLIRFKFFDEFKNIIIKELKSKKYDIIVHSAAVSDFKPQQTIAGKLTSGKIYNVRLLPLPKIIQYIRNLAPKAKLLMFKLESGISDKTLIQRAKSARSKVDADFIVANRLYPYRAFIIDDKGNMIPVKSKNELTKKLLTTLI